MDVNQLFASAEAAFVAKRYADARQLLQQVQRAAGAHEAVLHLLALVEKRSGDLAAAESAFVAALKLAPHDPQINGNYANLLEETGRPDAALALYDAALAADARFVDARLNRGLLFQRLGRQADAGRDFDDVLKINPSSARAHSARGSLLRDQGRFAEAATAYDAALALVPGHAKALDGRARVALETGETGAAERFRRALAAQPNSAELTLGLAEALEAAGDEEALSVLADAVARRPDWIEAQQRLAEMRIEQRVPGDFTASYHEAFAQGDAEPALHVSHWRSLALAGRHAEALEAMDCAGLPEDRDMRLMRAVFVGEAGEPERAIGMLAGLGQGTDVATVCARAHLRLHDFKQAAAGFEGVVRAQPGDVAAWAHLGLAWRGAGDARHDWLCGQPGLFDAISLEIDGNLLDCLATLLRSLHRTRAHPIGQSLRGGTQTRGTLFWRGETELSQLKAAIDAAIAKFTRDLPPYDAGHPLLRHRDEPFTVTGSWSVRLQSSGFHVSHIHPKGVLSSACYISLPPDMGTNGTDGWLELGRPPAELGLDFEPVAMIEPRPGRLALFPSYLYHGTRPFAAGERLTVAFDVAAH